MHPAFPDIVGQWAAEAIEDEAREERLDPPVLGTLNELSRFEQIIDVLVIAAAEQEIAETRSW